jgi:hypothetical protein
MVDVRNAQQNGQLYFTWPGTTETVLIEAEMIRENPTDGFLWAGNIKVGGQGYVIFGIKDGLKFGLLNRNGADYELIPFGTTRQVLVNRSSSETNSCGVAPNVSLPDNITSTPPNLDCEGVYGNNVCPALINVLLVITPESEPKVSGIWGGSTMLSILAAAHMNFALYNSHVFNKEIKVRAIFVSNPQFPFSNPINPNTDLGRLIDFADDIKNASPPNPADIVVLVTDQNYGLIAGITYLLEDVPDPSKAVAIVQFDYFFTNVTFVHEIGHILGCRHGWDQDVVPVCEHGYRHLTLGPILEPYFDWGVGYSWRTIMQRAVTEEEEGSQFILVDSVANWYWEVDDYGPILHFSDPLVNYQGDPTGRGTGLVTNNAEKIRNSGCIVAGYDDTPELNVVVTHNKSCEQQVFSAAVSPPAPGQPGQGPYTINWYYNDSGIFVNNPNGYSNYFGSGTNVTLPIPPNCPVYWVLCVVNAADGATYITRITKVSLSPECGPCEHDFSSPNATAVPFEFLIAPNPVANGTVQIHPQTATPKGQYEILDFSGRLVKSGVVPQGMVQPFSIEIGGIPSGAYTLRITPLAGILAPSSNTFIIQPK